MTRKHPDVFAGSVQANAAEAVADSKTNTETTKQLAKDKMERDWYKQLSS